MCVCVWVCDDRTLSALEVDEWLAENESEISKLTNDELLEFGFQFGRHNLARQRFDFVTNKIKSGLIYCSKLALKKSKKSGTEKEEWKQTYDKLSKYKHCHFFFVVLFLFWFDFCDIVFIFLYFFACHLTQYGFEMCDFR